MNIIDQIENRRRGFKYALAKSPENLVLVDWQLTQLIEELREVSGFKVTELNSFRDMKILKMEETIFLAQQMEKLK